MGEAHSRPQIPGSPYHISFPFLYLWKGRVDRGRVQDESSLGWAPWGRASKQTDESQTGWGEHGVIEPEDPWVGKRVSVDTANVYVCSVVALLLWLSLRSNEVLVSLGVITNKPVAEVVITVVAVFGPARA